MSTTFLVTYNSSGQCNVVTYDLVSGWGTPTTLGANTNRLMVTPGAAVGSAFILYEDTGATSFKVVYRNGAGSLGTPTTVVSTVGTTLLGSILVFGTNLFIPYVTGGNLVVAIANVSSPSGALTFVTHTVANTVSSSLSGWIGPIPDVDGGHPTVVFTGASGLFMTFSRSGTGLDWSIPTLIKAGYFTGGQFGAVGLGTAGYVYYGAGGDLNTYYDTFRLPAPSPTINSPIIPNGQVNTPYSFPINVTARSPYIVTPVSGALPPGLVISPLGVISGTPTVPGTYPFQIQLFPTGGSPVIAPFTITVTPQAPPAGKSPWTPGPLWLITTSCAKTGQYGLQRVADGIVGSSNTTSSQRVVVTQGQNWFIELFVRAAAGTNGIIGYGFTWYDVNGTALSTDVILSSGSSTNWTQFTGTIVAPAGAVSAQPIVEAIGHTTGSWCVNALFSVAQDEFFSLSSIKSYFSDYELFR